MSSISDDDFHAYTFGVFTLDTGRGALLKDGVEIKLRPQSFEILRVLVSRSGILVTREELQSAVWGHKVVTDDSLAHCIIDIRKALGDSGRKIIRTVPRRGYIFDEQVVERRGPTLERVSIGNFRQRIRFVLVSAALAVTALTALWFFVDADLRIIPTARSKSIAVLPFLDLSEDRSQRYFADGLTEEILNSLARTPDLLVTARTSSFAYRDSQDDVPTIAAALRVDHILEGSVRRGGDRLRITAQLIRASDGIHLWSQTFDKTPDDIITIQEEIAISIAGALQTAMDPEALAKMMRVDTRSVPAFEAYVTGNGAWAASWSDIELRLDAWDAYEKAVALDPEFTRAYDRLFWFWHMQLSGNSVSYGLTELTYQEILLKRDESLNNAIRTEKDASTLLKYQAHKAWVDMKPKRALRLITEFLEQNPNAQTGRAMRLVLLRLLNLQYEIDEDVETAYGQRELNYSGASRFWLSALEFSNNKNLMRTVAYDVIENFGDDVSLLYGAHHVLLIAGDIDGAGAILPEILNYTKIRKQYYLADLRQACAELRMADAVRIHTKALQE
ncbi:MAG: winged helix-turn-helix domain-containing protein, partial [Candidatus Poribacteria bacterium]|nr:winged helix-turn-helix domain-containing protein [Candidatus Poribacteria bacterium]